MKYFILFIVLFFLLAQLSVSQTKSNKGNIVTFVGGGLSFPMTESNFKDNYDYGFNVAVSVGYKLNKTYLVRGGMQYNRFPYSDIGVATGSFTATVLNAEILVGAFNVKQKFHPYGVAGMGIYFISSKLNIGGSESKSNDNDVGFGVGGGITIDLSKTVGIYIESQYHFMINDLTAKGFLPLIAGLTFAP